MSLRNPLFPKNFKHEIIKRRRWTTVDERTRRHRDWNNIFHCDNLEEKEESKKPDVIKFGKRARESKRRSLCARVKKKKKKSSSSKKQLDAHCKSIPRHLSLIARFIARVFSNKEKKKKKKPSRRDRSRSVRAHKELFSTRFVRSIALHAWRSEKKKVSSSFFFPLVLFFFFSRRSDTLESSNAHSSARFTRSLPRSRPLDSSVSIERTWLRGEDPLRIRMCSARACSIMRSRDRGRRMVEERWSKRIINAILGKDNALIQWRGSLMEFHEPLPE